MTLASLLTLPLSGHVAGVPENWSMNDRRDAVQLAHQFQNTCRHGVNWTPKTTVHLIPASKHSDAYESEAKRLSTDRRPTLDRTVAPSSTPRSTVAEPIGYAIEKLGFHGTLNRNIESIIKDGFRKPQAHGNHGAAIYTHRTASYSHDFAFIGGDQTHLEIFGCVVLAFSGELFGDIYAVVDPARVRTLLVFKYPRQ